MTDIEKFTLCVNKKRSDNKTYLSKWTSLRALTSTLWPWVVIWRLKTLIFAEGTWSSAFPWHEEAKLVALVMPQIVASLRP